jgi:hypothetical protein
MATGKFSSDASDVLEGMLLTHPTESTKLLVERIKADEMLADEIKQMHITDNELVSYIHDTFTVYQPMLNKRFQKNGRTK